MKTYHKTVSQIIEDESKNARGAEDCPLPLGIIPNHMGINLCSVDSISWQEQEDGQLSNLTIYFLPNTETQ